MRPTLVPPRIRRPANTVDLAGHLDAGIIGQSGAVRQIVPYVQMFQAGLSPEGRPAGVFLLMGPTGTGKTRTVEVLADALHGSEKSVVRVDCGEFQMEHEVAKLIGAPPGYLGHRETQPMLTQQKLSLATSESSSLALVLFDEIEKAAASMTRLLLGILDKATLRLGDNSSVNFDRTLIFFTSNLGARAMMKEIRPDFGFAAGLPASPSPGLSRKLENIGRAAVRRRFSPEFVNRIDEVITYAPLGADSLAAILDQQIAQLQQHIDNRLEERAFRIELTEAARSFLLNTGASDRYGARELKRTLYRELVHPLAAMVASDLVEPGSTVGFVLHPEGGLSIVQEGEH